MTINCLVIDSDEETHKAITQVIGKMDALGNIKHLRSMDGIMNIINKNPVEIIFIDPHTKGLNGDMKKVKKIVEPVANVVFMSALREAAKDAYDYNAVDFLLKPLMPAHILRTMSKIAKRNNNGKEQSGQRSVPLFVKTNNVLHRIDKSAILVVEALADYVKILTEKKVYTIHSTMKKIEKLLGEEGFIRVHKSYIVRIDAISEVNDKAVLIGDRKIPLSRTYKDLLKKELYIL